MLTQMKTQMPVNQVKVNVGKKAGLVTVDLINGFCTPGAGNLAPPAPDERIDQMVKETDRLARKFENDDQPIMVFCDTHEPGKAEDPYPTHCVAGTGEEELVPPLKWMEQARNTTILGKNCINGFVGGIDLETGRNAVVEWINQNQIEQLVVVGICTDICVMDFVLTILSARNHGLVPTLKDIIVYEPGCATYDLPREVAIELGLPETAAHPRVETHYMGLYFMATRGAIIANELEFAA